MDIKLAWRNIWRNPRRSVLTMAAISFATILLVFMLSWQFGSYATMINASVKIRTGHLQIQAQGYQEKHEIRQVIEQPGAVAEILDQIPGITGYTFRAEGFSLVSSDDRTMGTLVVGIMPEKEKRVSTVAHMIEKGHYLDAEDQDLALVGHLLAKNFKADVGDELVVLGQGRDGSIAATVVRIKGIFNSGLDEFDRSVIYMPLSYFQQVYSMRGSVNAAVINCTSLDAIPDVKSGISKGIASMDHLVVLDWKELAPGLLQAIKMDLISGFMFYVVLIVVVAFSILNTFLMVIFERTKEFGVMMAMGTRPGRLMRILLIESFSMTAIGVATGILLGSLLTWYFQIHGIVIPGMEEFTRQFGLPERIYPELSFLSVAIGAGIVWILTGLTAIYPVFKVKGLQPVKALAAV